MSFSNPVVGGEGGELIRDSIKSPNFVAGVSGWIIRRDGSAEFNNVNIRFDLTAGSIVVGPTGLPQVIIRSTGTDGIIEFPTNSVNEDGVAFIKSSIELAGQAAERLSLNLRSPSVNGTGNYASIEMKSAAENGATLQRIAMGLTGLSGLQQIEVNATENNYYNALHVFDNEIYVGDSFADSNYPVRVVDGKTFTGTTNTTIGTGAATLIADAQSSSVRLVNGVAYKVDMHVPISATLGFSVAGTQRITWTLWDGAVGGTRLGNLNRSFKVGAVSTNQEDMVFSFVFKYTGATGNKTLNLGGQHTVGTDTLQAHVTVNYFMVVNRIGDPNMIENL